MDDVKVNISDRTWKLARIVAEYGVPLAGEGVTTIAGQNVGILFVDLSSRPECRPLLRGAARNCMASPYLPLGATIPSVVFTLWGEDHMLAVVIEPMHQLAWANITALAWTTLVDASAPGFDMSLNGPHSAQMFPSASKEYARWLTGNREDQDG